MPDKKQLAIHLHISQCELCKGKFNVLKNFLDSPVEGWDDQNEDEDDDELDNLIFEQIRKQ